MKQLLILFLLLVACNKTDENGYKIFVIQQGNHYADGTEARLCGNDIKFNYIFGEGCAYDETQIIPGWNKLYGFSNVAWEGNHDYSCRLAWRWDSKIQKVIVGYYAYINKIRIDGELDTVSLGSENYGRTRYVWGGYMMQSNEHFKFLPNVETSTLYFIQHPYFGGQSAAPHKMTILIKEI